MPVLREPDGTLTAEIFSCTAPYNNPYQSDRGKWLFVCSAGLLRSPTAAQVGSEQFNLNTRSCGTHSYALIPISVNLILWAEHIVFMENDLKATAVANFCETEYLYDLESKAIVWDIPDIYPAYDPKLQQLIKENLRNYLK